MGVQAAKLAFGTTLEGALAPDQFGADVDLRQRRVDEVHVERTHALGDAEAGQCLVMQARIDGRPTILVLLDAAGAQSRFTDAQRLRRWVEQQPRAVRTVADTRS